jgi:hypothetical protein
MFNEPRMLNRPSRLPHIRRQPQLPLRTKHQDPSGTSLTWEESFYGALGCLMGDGCVAKRLGMGERTVGG